jgi:hypothetical protein
MKGGTLRPNQYIFFVFREGDWKIQRREGLSARYRTQQEALLDALHCARKAGKRGEVVEVFLERDILPIAFGRESLERIIDNSRRSTISAEVD